MKIIPSVCFPVAGTVLALLLAGCRTEMAPATRPLGASTAGAQDQCHPSPVPGLVEGGFGRYGCHFVLRDPRKGEPLPSTAYGLAVYRTPLERSGPRGEPIAFIFGTTDSQARTGFLRAPFPYTSDSIALVQVLGTGPRRLGTRLVAPEDGAAVPFAQFRVDACGFVYEGVTDARGDTPLFAVQETCRVMVEFARSGQGVQEIR